MYTHTCSIFSWRRIFIDDIQEKEQYMVYTHLLNPIYPTEQLELAMKPMIKFHPAEQLRLAMKTSTKLKHLL